MLIIKLKKLFKSTVLISALAVSFLSPEVKAQEAVTFIPRALWMSKAEQWLKTEKIHLQNETNGLQLSSSSPQFSIISDRVKYAVDINIVKASESLATDFIVQQLQAETGRFQFTALIQKDLGFGLANLKLNVQCQNLIVKLAQPIHAQAQFELSSSRVSLKDMHLPFEANQLDFQLVGCNEVAGFDELLKSELGNWVKSQALFNYLNEALHTQAISLLTTKVDEVVEKFTQTYFADLKSKSVLDESGNVWLFSESNETQQLTTEDFKKIAQSKKAISVVSKVGLEKRVQNILNEKIRGLNISSTNNESLKKLTCSRLYQFFLWPALRALDKCFEMSFINRISELKITNLKQLTVDVTVGSWAQNAKGQNPNKDLAYFATEFKTSLRSKETSLFSFSGTSFPAFIQWAGKSSRISTSFLESSIEGLLKQTIRAALSDTQMNSWLGAAELKEFNKNFYQIEINL